MSALTPRAGIAHELNPPIANSLPTATALSDMVAEFDKKYHDDGAGMALKTLHQVFDLFFTTKMGRAARDWA